MQSETSHGVENTWTATVNGYTKELDPTSSFVPSCGPHAADNLVTQLLDIPEPRPCNLRGADFRTNRITGFKDVAHQLQAFSSLRDLALDNNIIESAAGLAALSNLLHLSITNNCLRHCHGLDALTVRPCIDTLCRRCAPSGSPWQLHGGQSDLPNSPNTSTLIILCRVWYT